VLGSQIKVSACPKCGGANLVNDPESGEEICTECGLVVSEGMLDAGPEWRAFTILERDERARTGMQTTPILFDRGLSTNFRGLKDGVGKPLNVAVLGKMNRLRRYDHRSKINDSQARNLSIAMPELDRVATQIHLSEMAKLQAAQLYRKVLDKDLVRGRSIESFVAASIYAVCRMNGIPRPLRNISKASTRDYLEVARSYRILVRELDLRMPIDDSMKFVTSIASKLGVERRTEQRAVEILMLAKKHKGLAGKYPRGVAAAALYLACLENKEKRTQKDVATAAGTSEVTLRNRVRGLGGDLDR
jgi:transcription initiation factor TFIIB